MSKNLKILLASPRGFCAGVDRAIEIVKKALVKLNYLTDKVATGEGSLGKLVNDDKLYNAVNELSTNLNELIKKINSGQGTLGKLINDDRLYYDALNSVRKLKNATETQEDLAPLTTITAAFGVMTLF